MHRRVRRAIGNILANAAIGIGQIFSWIAFAGTLVIGVYIAITGFLDGNSSRGVWSLILAFPAAQLVQTVFGLIGAGLFALATLFDPTLDIAERTLVDYGDGF